MGEVVSLRERSSFEAWVPLKLSVHSAPENDHFLESSVTIDVQSGTEDNHIYVDMILSAGDTEWVKYDVSIRGVWNYEGEQPEPDSLQEFVYEHALPRIASVVNSELTALASRVKKPHPVIPDDFPNSYKIVDPTPAEDKS